MARFVSLISWTELRVRTTPDTTKRADAATAEFARLGGKLTDLYWTLGPYDLVPVSEFPDDETATAAALRLAAGGNVRTTTMRAFGRDEVKKIIAKAKGYIDARREKPRTGRGSAHDLRLGRQALPLPTHAGWDRGTSATVWLQA